MHICCRVFVDTADHNVLSIVVGVNLERSGGVVHLWTGFYLGEKRSSNTRDYPMKKNRTSSNRSYDELTIPYINSISSSWLYHLVMMCWVIMIRNSKYSRKKETNVQTNKKTNKQTDKKTNNKYWLVRPWLPRFCILCICRKKSIFNCIN